MKTIITMLFALVAIASNAKDLTITGYLLNNNEEATIEIYQAGELVETKCTLSKHYKLKLEPGEYMVLFHNKTTFKRLYIRINEAMHIKIDVDFKSNSDAIVELNKKRLMYRRISQNENYELSISS